MKKMRKKHGLQITIWFGDHIERKKMLDLVMAIRNTLKWKTTEVKALDG